MTTPHYISTRIGTCSNGGLLRGLPDECRTVLEIPWIADTLLRTVFDKGCLDVLKDMVSPGAVQRELEFYLRLGPNSLLGTFLDTFQTTKKQLIDAITQLSERRPLNEGALSQALNRLNFNPSEEEDKGYLGSILNQPTFEGFVNSYHALLKWTTTVGVSQEWLEELTEKLERKPPVIMERIFGPQNWDPASVKVLAPVENQNVNELGKYVKLSPAAKFRGSLTNCFISLNGEGCYDLSELNIDGAVLHVDNSENLGDIKLPKSTRNVTLIGFRIVDDNIEELLKQNHRGLMVNESQLFLGRFGNGELNVTRRLRWSFNEKQREENRISEPSDVEAARSVEVNSSGLTDLYDRQICEMLNSLLSLGPKEGEECFMRLRFTAGPPLHNHILIVSRIKEESESSAKDPKFLVLFEDPEHSRGVHDREVGIWSPSGYTNIFKKINGAARLFNPNNRIREHLEGITNFPFDVSWPVGINAINELGRCNKSGNIRYTTPVKSSELGIFIGDDDKINVRKNR